MASDLNGAGRGLNFVVVNPETKEVVRVARFDTFASGSVIKDADFKKNCCGAKLPVSIIFQLYSFPSLSLSQFFVYFPHPFRPRASHMSPAGGPGEHCEFPQLDRQI